MRNLDSGPFPLASCMDLGKSTNLSRPVSSSVKDWSRGTPKIPSDSKILRLYDLTNIDYKQQNPLLVAMGEGKGSKNKNVLLSRWR